MLRMSTEGKEGVTFGLYTTTGRAVSFLAPFLILGVHRLVRRGPGRHRWPACWYWQRAWRCWHWYTRRTGFRRASGRRCRSSGRCRYSDCTWTPLTVTEQVTCLPTLMIVTLAESSAGLGKSDFLAPRQHDVELRLQHAAGVDVGDVDRPAGSGDLVDH